MKKGIILTAMMFAMLMYLLPSCYKNKEDILTLPTVSFRSDIVPIVVSGNCGCHNNGQGKTAVQFSHVDTVFYDVILGRAGVFDAWTKGGTHPGGGIIDFKPSDKLIIQKWISQGAKDDGGGCTVTGAITYTADIAPIYNTTCKGATCHGGLGAVLDYATLVSKKSVLVTMMNSGGATGHPGGTISLGTCTVKTIQEWINQGQPN